MVINSVMALERGLNHSLRLTVPVSTLQNLIKYTQSALLTNLYAFVALLFANLISLLGIASSP